MTHNELERDSPTDENIRDQMCRESSNSAKAPALSRRWRLHSWTEARWRPLLSQNTSQKSGFALCRGKWKSDRRLHPHPAPDQHQKLTTSRGSSLAHAMFGRRQLRRSSVILLTDRMTERTITLLRQDTTASVTHRSCNRQVAGSSSGRTLLRINFEQVIKQHYLVGLPTCVKLG